MSVKIAVVPGDGIGPEVTHEAVTLLDAVNTRFALGITYEHIDVGAERYLRTGEVLPASALESMASCDAILLGALGDPRVAPGVLERGVIVTMRTRFRQAANLRPIKLLPGVTSPLRHLTHDQCDLVIVRENTEGLYAGGGSTAHAGTSDAVAVHTSITTAAATETVVRYAFQLARTRRHRLTLCHKTNILIDAGVIWQHTMDRLATEFTDVEVDYAHADAMCLHLINQPQRYDVIVTDNLFGDILSDLGAAVQGGLGTAASANLNLDGSGPSMFEPVHGSAPDIAGKSLANPAAAMLSVALMLESLDRPAAAAACRDAVNAALIDHARRATPMNTQALGEQVLAALERL